MNLVLLSSFLLYPSMWVLHHLAHIRSCTTGAVVHCTTSSQPIRIELTKMLDCDWSNQKEILLVIGPLTWPVIGQFQTQTQQVIGQIPCMLIGQTLNIMTVLDLESLI